MLEFDYNKIFISAGIKQGDVIDVVTDLADIILNAKKQKFEFIPKNFLTSLCEFIGREGTVLVRSFCWDFCKGKPYDIRLNRSQAGALANVAMNMPEFKRTSHAIYSWFVWGKLRDYFCSFNNIDSFGYGSIFEWEEKNPSYILRVGNTKASGLTIIYRILQNVDVPFRYLKKWYGKYIDENGCEEKKCYSMYVRHIDDTSENSPSDFYLDDIIKSGCGIIADVCGIKIHKYSLPSVCKLITDDFNNNFPGKPYKKDYIYYKKNMKDDLLSYLTSAFPDINFKASYYLAEDKIISLNQINEIADVLEQFYSIKIPEIYRKDEYFNSINSMTSLAGLLLGKKNENYKCS